MNDNSNTTAPEIISCEVCLKEVPKSEAESAEASDYVFYFCGHHCFEEWQEKHDSE